MEVTVIVALITTMAAIIAPVITSHIQRNSLKEIKQLEVLYKDKSEAYKAFAAAFGEINQFQYTVVHNKLLSSAYQAQLLSNSNCSDEIMKLLNMIRSIIPANGNEIQTQFLRCMDLLNSDL